MNPKYEITTCPDCHFLATLKDAQGREVDLWLHDYKVPEAFHLYLLTFVYDNNKFVIEELGRIRVLATPTPKAEHFLDTWVKVTVDPVMQEAVDLADCWKITHMTNGAN